MKLPVLSGKEIIKLLCSLNFQIKRQSGSHVILVKKSSTSKIVVVVPKHNEIAKGTLLSIIAQAGLTKEEFLKLI